MAPDDDRSPADTQGQDSARRTWDELALRARALHCPEHFALPWRVVVIGDRPDRLRLQVYGCCEKVGQAVTAMIKADPRLGGPG